ncbi:MAG: hypothetical protein WAM89_09970 [Terriglobales bacterium]
MKNVSEWSAADKEVKAKEIGGFENEKPRPSQAWTGQSPTILTNVEFLAAAAV